mmetsp:Transcript_88739/g.198405  ORF Transcript_88739/g.198405 Transcript_88739/m.198405 type:complete len:323 (-) Transcript_88739:7-975(-)
MKLRMRDCSCIKKWMRATGADKFDDFEVVILVHEVLMTSNKPKVATVVRVTAGAQTVQTDESNKGIYQQPLSVYVEQGTDCVELELMESRSRKVLAYLKLDPMQDILRPKAPLLEKTLPMKQKNKGVLNPRIKLTAMLESGNEAEQGLLSGVDMGSETNMLLRQQLNKVKMQHPEDNDPEAATEDIGASSSSNLSDLDLLAKGCCGPLELFGSWGHKENVYMGVRGPPNSKNYYLGIWKAQDTFEKGTRGNPEIDLFRVTSVTPDPSRAEVFIMCYLDERKVKKRLTFRRLDRARDVWVEMFGLLMKMLHEQREKKKKTRTQ